MTWKIMLAFFSHYLIHSLAPHQPNGIESVGSMEFARILFIHGRGLSINSTHKLWFKITHTKKTISKQTICHEKYSAVCIVARAHQLFIAHLISKLTSTKWWAPHWTCLGKKQNRKWFSKRLNELKEIGWERRKKIAHADNEKNK